MLDSFDYKEPSCSLCGGGDFYNPNSSAPIGRIPVDRVIAKVDECFESNDLKEASRLLEFWQKEAIFLKDLRGELSVLSELAGLYRKTSEEDKALKTVKRALELLETLKFSDTVSGATILLNCATTLKAFNKADESIPLYKKVEKVYNERLEKGNSLFGGLYNNMALALADVNQTDKALEYYNKALGVMSLIEGGELECAITYVNMANLYENIGNKERINYCLIEASSLLLEYKKQTGYYAFVCEKCIPSFEYFNFIEVAENLSKRVKDIYERS